MAAVIPRRLLIEPAVLAGRCLIAERTAALGWIGAALCLIAERAAALGLIGAALSVVLTLLISIVPVLPLTLLPIKSPATTRR